MLDALPFSRVIVTGGTGFIGRAVINKLIAHGIECVSLALPGEAMPAHWEGMVTVQHGDISDVNFVQKSIDSADCVIHLAALLGQGSYAQHEAITVKGTENVLEACRQTNARVIVISSIAAYGRYVRDRICTEDVGYGPWNGPYSWAKQRQEEASLRCYNKYGLPITVIRPANVYGAGSLPWVDVVVAAIKAGAPILINHGRGNAGLVHVNNLADAIILTAVSENTIGNVFNVCDELDVSWHDYFSDIAKLVGLDLAQSVDFSTLEELALEDEDPEGFQTPTEYRSIPLATLDLIGSDNRFPSALLRERTRWSPTVSYQEGIKDIQRYLEQLP